MLASVAVPQGLINCGSQALEGADFSWGHGLSGSTAWRTFLDEELKLSPLHWKVDSYSLSHLASPSIHFYLFIYFYFNLI